MVVLAVPIKRIFLQITTYLLFLNSERNDECIDFIMISIYVLEKKNHV